MELGCGSARVVSGLPAEAQLVNSCGMPGLGVNDRLKYLVCFSWVLLGDEFAFSVEGLDIVLFVWNEHIWAT